MADESYLIYYDGEHPLLERYCTKLGELGFVKEESFRIESLDLTVVRCRYDGQDAAEGIKQAQSLDEKIRIEVNKDYHPTQKA
jgi:hypothetical protein